MRTVRVFRALAALAVLPTGLAYAQFLQDGAGLVMSVTLDSNPGLSPTGAEAVWRFMLTPDYQLSRVDGADTLNARAAVQVERSSDPSLSADRESPSLSFGWRRETPRGEFGLSAKYEESPTRTSELLDTGRVAADATRQSAEASADWRTALDKRNSLALAGALRSVSYQGGGDFTDYTELSGSATFVHEWDARTEPYAKYAVSRYTPDGGGPSSDSHTVEAGLKRAFSELLSGEAHAGIRWNGSQASSGWQGGVALNYAGRRSNWSWGAARTASASGAGAFVESDQANMSWTYAVSEKSNAGIDLIWRRNRSNDAPGEIRNFTAWAGRELDEFWNLRFSYQYKEVGQGPTDASAHVLGLTLMYLHPDLPDL